ncbi:MULTISPECIES: TetR/AcrR family transcriptional regulator [unclassified Nocardiopsis]|uniref:TetR/AcrR family transcriptional regulator n=1 Tax=unclassified Nocardiopsis TaxID=2649073 RepID=UPI00135AD37C|nr:MULTISPECIES: TetR/AcrR family transcriptional regulator [unclassified Nocardiopsis]
MTSASRPLGRGAKVRAAVLAATLTELGERGYSGLSVEGVAQRAGVHKTTVYRRWRDRQSLVVDALGQVVAQDVPMPDTGTLEGDLRAMARSLVDVLASPTGAVIAAMLADAVRIPEVARARDRMFDDRVARARPVVERARARGELPPHTDPRDLVRALAAPVYLRLLVTGDPLDARAVEEAVRSALAAARPTGNPPAAPASPPAEG